MDWYTVAIGLLMITVVDDYVVNGDDGDHGETLLPKLFRI